MTSPTKLEDRQARNRSLHTQRVYEERVARFGQRFGRSTAELGRQEIRATSCFSPAELLAPSSVVIAMYAFQKVTLK